MKTIVVYGSTTGNNANIAGMIHETLAGGGIDALLCNVNEVQPAIMKEYDVIVIGSSTWGDGELQDDMMAFHDNMASIDLQGKKFATFGVGEDSWPNFCTAPEILFDRMKKCGAESVFEILKVNGDAEASRDRIVSWAQSLLKNI